MSVQTSHTHVGPPEPEASAMSDSSAEIAVVEISEAPAGRYNDWAMIPDFFQGVIRAARCKVSKKTNTTMDADMYGGLGDMIVCWDRFRGSQKKQTNRRGITARHAYSY